jgi:hypothetical protein
MVNDGPDGYTVDTGGSSWWDQITQGAL